MRIAACLMLVPALLAAGCDRHSPVAGQGNEAAAAPAATPATAPAATPAAAGRIDRSYKGEAAPAFAFTGPDGKATTLAAFRGKPVLLNLWATWCGPCVKELPTLDALAKREAGRLTVVAISQDTDASKVAPFLKDRHLTTLTPYTDEKMVWVPAVASNLPTSILFDAEGREVWRVLGDMDWTGPAAADALKLVS
ncbi:Thiol-disulfide isomerase or thioredoxin [Sphingomonas gellani]|uniref:Thiol-disulfide isomerase or thioredoxin n=1 Tax=Sphingomonas gellani TaxID=1166340 RepID=A0A1H8CDS1_9SPHN|nr:TlpA disulfide reductase family protein [Sphingomonas gellani]SEM93411.1 Thiol-disulfide isomerase or thioredoxin [Sphingomonas gellani]